MADASASMQRSRRAAYVARATAWLCAQGGGDARSAAKDLSMAADLMAGLETTWSVVIPQDVLRQLNDNGRDPCFGLLPDDSSGSQAWGLLERC